MGFMRQDITDRQEWLEIDGTAGTEYTPLDLLSKEQVLTARHCANGHEYDREDLQAIFEDWYSGEVWTVTVTTGYGARMSAPGYLDATEWSVFDSEEDAREHLAEFYGDEDEDDHEDEEN